MTPNPLLNNTELEAMLKRLYSLDTHGKELSDKAHQTLQMLRQLINEEFVHKKKQITTQQLYDVLEEIL